MRHGQPPENSLAAKTIRGAVNLLSVIYAQVYFPTFSNGLKEIAGHLGFRWSDSTATGTQAIRWRHEWAASRDPFQKSLLVTYNVEDCKALEVVAKRASTLGGGRPRVIVPNKTIECPRPRSCPKCASANFFKHTKYSKTLVDLKFMRRGIKRWVTRYRFHRYQCQACGVVFQPEETCWGKSKFGSEIKAYSLYLNIELRLPQVHIASKLNRVFDLHLDAAAIGNFKEEAAEKYEGTFNALVNRLCSGPLLHVDEAKVKLRDKDGFVWVFANMEDVAYVYSDTREGDLVQTMLKDFKGVLVSDFYAAYDAIQCP